jgi:hypothetical protein
LLKLLYGTPAGLPRAIQDLPLGLGLTFRLAIALELVIAALALLRPARGWLPLALLLAAFLSVLATQVAAGDTSCGCFGDALTIAPTLMVALDGLLLLVLLAGRPWRAGSTDPQAPWVVVVLLALLLAALPWLYNRETTSGGQITTGRGFVDLEVEQYQGKRFADTVLYSLLPKDLRLEDGLYVIWSPTCEVCAEHLEALYYSEQNAERDVVLVRSIPNGEEPSEEDVKVHVLPEGEWIKRFDLPLEKDWLATPPVHIVVQKGMVETCVWGMDALGK